MFTDIVGYSEKMSRDENQALQWLDFHDKAAAEIIKAHNGNLIKKMGDGMLVDFPSVIDALKAAHTFQHEIKNFNQSQQDSDKLLVRIGIHIGDVLQKDKDIFGNGVNIAARIQQICIPGGICLSQAAHAAIGDSSNYDFIVLSKVKLKNIAENYSVFQLPSIYPNEFPIQQNTNIETHSDDFIITSIKKIPPEKLSIVDAMLIAVGIMVALDFSIAYFTMKISDLSLNQAILKLSNYWMLFYSLIFTAIFTIILLRDAVEIKFEDVRGADQLLSYIIQRFGFNPPVKKDNHIVFKPTLYNSIMWSTQKMKVAINGNTITISGSFLFLRKVKRMLKSYQK
jgi:hypothetical protein